MVIYQCTCGEEKPFVKCDPKCPNCGLVMRMVEVDVVVERDPDGLDPSAPGAKLDDGKPTYSLLFGQCRDALAAVNGVMEYGARKYSVGGWVHVEDGERRYTEALIRHVLAELAGEVVDESGLMHDAQVACNALFRLQLRIDREKSEVS